MEVISCLLGACWVTPPVWWLRHNKLRDHGMGFAHTLALVTENWGWLAMGWLPIHGHVMLKPCLAGDLDSRFWIDHWSQGKTVAELAPNLIKIISKQAVKQWTVSQALDGRRWVADIKGALIVEVLWDLLENFALQQNVPDQHIWCLPSQGPILVSCLTMHIFSVPSSLRNENASGNHGLSSAASFFFYGWRSRIGSRLQIVWIKEVAKSQCLSPLW